MSSSLNGAFASTPLRRRYCEPEATLQVFVDGDRFEGDPATIELVDQKEIAIVIGSPPETIPTSFDFGQP